MSSCSLRNRCQRCEGGFIAPFAAKCRAHAPTDRFGAPQRRRRPSSRPIGATRVAPRPLIGQATLPSGIRRLASRHRLVQLGLGGSTARLFRLPLSCPPSGPPLAARSGKADSPKCASVMSLRYRATRSPSRRGVTSRRPGKRLPTSMAAWPNALEILRRPCAQCAPRRQRAGGRSSARSAPTITPMTTHRIDREAEIHLAPPA